MNEKDIINFVAKIEKPTLVNLTTLTKVTLAGGKKNSQQGRITKKTSDALVMLYPDTTDNSYEKMVKEQMVKEGKDPSAWSVGARKWGVRVGNTCLIEHKGSLYLEAHYIQKGTTEYFIDGNNPISLFDIEGLKESKPSQNENFQGGIQNMIEIRTISVESIIDIQIAQQKEG
jgi:hypothetical protein